MSPLTEPTTLVLRKTWQPMDPDAAAYITAVEAADTAAGQSGGLEEKTKIAIDNFVLGCKADGIWSAIKASCILAGARTLNGALVPLVGSPPVNNGPFDLNDYLRKTGLKGDASAKYLNANRAGSDDTQDNVHAAVYVTEPFSAGQYILGTDVAGGLTGIGRLSSSRYSTFAQQSSGFISPTLASTLGFVGVSRVISSQFNSRIVGVDSITTSTSQTKNTSSYGVFAVGAGANKGSGRLAFYSLGQSLDLALLDARVTDLINAIGAAIP